MDFIDRLKRNADRIRAMRPQRLSPSASIRIAVQTGAWSGGAPLERLARLSAACLVALRSQPLLGGTYDGNKRLRADPDPGLWVGVEGGRGWAQIDAASQPAQIADRLAQAEARVRVPGPGLEVLDLSTLRVSDWRGSLAKPQLARLVLLAPEWVPGEEGDDGGAAVEVMGLALDFDQRLMDAAQAAAFLNAVASELAQGDG